MGEGISRLVPLQEHYWDQAKPYGSYVYCMSWRACRPAVCRACLYGLVSATIDGHHDVQHDEVRDTYEVPVARSRRLRRTPFARLPPSLSVPASLYSLVCSGDDPLGLLTDGVRGGLPSTILSQAKSPMCDLSCRECEGRTSVRGTLQGVLRSTKVSCLQRGRPYQGAEEM
jgi:hypothetical protein